MEEEKGEFMKKKTLIYVAHPYGGDEENKKVVERFVDPLKKFKDITFISPIHSFWGYEKTDYLKGIDDCLSLLSQCDILAIPRFREIETSKGCLMELGFAKGAGITTVYWDELKEYLEAYEWEEEE